ncbi:ABC transporter ATP-binding protein [Oceanirhabdus sp. W0125-5]|uniref:ABC transporter ATP-binding protein n=1 Tax=Oceanirhabdus sp. W0125-5 TaxID=2999116 RepID=UPI0022F2FE8E|nr:ABC transporter ATP-binding protein [Oceanirhabdus sp. W0125-5]WBW94987.1 ABC transporter ATP-binding protein [Oceanirhabdus sp. W0125-5]
MVDLDRKNISVFSIVKICARYSPMLFVMCLALTVMDGLLVPMMLLVVANFIDSAITLASNEPQTYIMMKNAIFMGVGYFYMQLSQELKLYFYDLFEDTLRNKLKPEIIKKQFSMDYLLFESTHTQDLLLRVTKNIEMRFIKILKSSNSIVTLAIQVIGILFTLYKYNWWIVIIFVFIIIPIILLTFKGGKVIYESEKKVGFITRQMNYLSDVLSNREASAERTLFNYSHTINKRFKDAHLYRSNFNTKTLARETLRIKLCNIVINIFTIILIVTLSRQVYNNLLSVGFFTSIVGCMINLTKVISVQLSELILDFSSHNEYVKDFKEFIQLEENKEVFDNNREELKFESLHIKNLFFKYKDSKDYIIKGLNLYLEKGKSYSLVGLNGAGKTTLIKILVGLYRDFEGEILINGKDIKSYTFAELRSMFSLVSQDYAKYYVSLKDNIAFNKPEADINSVIEKLELGDLIRDLPDGENSYLGKMYDNGIDISGGQWQRIAIARALYKNSPFVILDEPTSSLSPTAESRVYSNFSKIAKDKTLLMISHRLGSTKISDEIIVLDSGRIAELGSHEELMNNDNIYAKLFNKQKEMYYE